MKAELLDMLVQIPEHELRRIPLDAMRELVQVLTEDEPPTFFVDGDRPTNFVERNELPTNFVPRNPRTVFTDLDDVQHDEDFDPREASEPTWHAPGSPGKIEAMRLRVERGESLWHPQDCNLPPEPKIVRVVNVPGIREVNLADRLAAAIE